MFPTGVCVCMCDCIGGSRWGDHVPHRGCVVCVCVVHLNITPFTHSVHVFILFSWYPFAGEPLDLMKRGVLCASSDQLAQQIRPHIGHLQYAYDQTD